MKSFVTCNLLNMHSEIQAAQVPPTKKRKERTSFNRSQLDELEQSFSTNQYPDSAMTKEIAGKVQLPKHTVMIWFKNRRVKCKRRQNKDNKGVLTAGTNTRSRKTSLTVVSVAPFSYLPKNADHPLHESSSEHTLSSNDSTSPLAALSVTPISVWTLLVSPSAPTHYNAFMSSSTDSNSYHQHNPDPYIPNGFHQDAYNNTYYGDMSLDDYSTQAADHSAPLAHTSMNYNTMMISDSHLTKDQHTTALSTTVSNGLNINGDYVQNDATDSSVYNVNDSYQIMYDNTSGNNISRNEYSLQTTDHAPLLAHLPVMTSNSHLTKAQHTTALSTTASNGLNINSHYVENDATDSSVYNVNDSHQIMYNNTSCNNTSRNEYSLQTTDHAPLLAQIPVMTSNSHLTKAQHTTALSTTATNGLNINGGYVENDATDSSVYNVNDSHEIVHNISGNNISRNDLCTRNHAQPLDHTPVNYNTVVTSNLQLNTALSKTASSGLSINGEYVSTDTDIYTPNGSHQIMHNNTPGNNLSRNDYCTQTTDHLTPLAYTSVNHNTVTTSILHLTMDQLTTDVSTTASNGLNINGDYVKNDVTDNSVYNVNDSHQFMYNNTSDDNISRNDYSLQTTDNASLLAHLPVNCNTVMTSNSHLTKAQNATALFATASNGLNINGDYMKNDATDTSVYNVNDSHQIMYNNTSGNNISRNDLPTTDHAQLNHTPVNYNTVMISNSQLTIARSKTASRGLSINGEYLSTDTGIYTPNGSHQIMYNNTPGNNLSRNDYCTQTTDPSTPLAHTSMNHNTVMTSILHLTMAKLSTDLSTTAYSGLNNNGDYVKNNVTDNSVYNVNDPHQIMYNTSGDNISRNEYSLQTTDHAPLLAHPAVNYNTVTTSNPHRTKAQHTTALSTDASNGLSMNGDYVKNDATDTSVYNVNDSHQIMNNNTSGNDLSRNDYSSQTTDQAPPLDYPDVNCNTVMTGNTHFTESELTAALSMIASSDLSINGDYVKNDATDTSVYTPSGFHQNMYNHTSGDSMSLYDYLTQAADHAPPPAHTPVNCNTVITGDLPLTMTQHTIVLSMTDSSVAVT